MSMHGREYNNMCGKDITVIITWDSPLVYVYALMIISMTYYTLHTYIHTIHPVFTIAVGITQKKCNCPKK